MPRPGKVSRRGAGAGAGSWRPGGWAGVDSTLHLASAQSPAPSVDISRYSVDTQ